MDGLFGVERPDIGGCVQGTAGPGSITAVSSAGTPGITACSLGIGLIRDMKPVSEIVAGMAGEARNASQLCWPREI